LPLILLKIYWHAYKIKGAKISSASGGNFCYGSEGVALRTTRCLNFFTGFTIQAQSLSLTENLNCVLAYITLIRFMQPPHVITKLHLSGLAGMLRHTPYITYRSMLHATQWRITGTACMA
jgi:hypothetical protein